MFFWLENSSEVDYLKINLCWALFFLTIKDSLKVWQRRFSGVLTAARIFLHHLGGVVVRAPAAQCVWAQPKHTQLLIAQMQITPGQFLFRSHFLPRWSHPFLGCQIQLSADGTLHFISASHVSLQFLLYFSNFLLSQGIRPAPQFPK